MIRRNYLRSYCATSSVDEILKPFKSLAFEEKSKIFFIHLNHTNPARDANFDDRRAIEEKGYHFATFGMRFSLD